MQRRSIAWLVSATLLAMLAVWWALTPQPLEVESARAESGTFILAIEEDGITRVRDRYAVTAPVAGTLLRPTVRAGDHVRRDDVVARIVPNPAQMLDLRTRAELAARVESAAARFDRASATMRQAAAALAQTENEHRRIEALGQQGYASQIERERAALTVELRRKDRDAAVFERDAARHDLQQARAALSSGNSGKVGGQTNAWLIKAPVDGQVLRVQQESESAIGVGGAILEIGDVSRLEASIDLLSTEATQVTTGAFVELDAGGDIRLTGRVRIVEPGARTKVSALGVEEQRVNVIVDVLPNPTAIGRVGDAFRVDARIEIAHRNAVVMIPTAALFRVGSNWATFRIVDGRAALTPLRIGLRSSDRAVVVEGVAAGDSVIVYPSDSVRDGVRVRPIEQGS